MRKKEKKKGMKSGYINEKTKKNERLLLHIKQQVFQQFLSVLLLRYCYYIKFFLNAFFFVMMCIRKLKSVVTIANKKIPTLLKNELKITAKREKKDISFIFLIVWCLFHWKSNKCGTAYTNTNNVYSISAYQFPFHYFIRFFHFQAIANIAPTSLTIKKKKKRLSTKPLRIHKHNETIEVDKPKKEGRKESGTVHTRKIKWFYNEVHGAHNLM